MTEGRDGFGPEQEKHQADHAADRLCGTAVLGTEQPEVDQRCAGQSAGPALAAVDRYLHRVCAEPDDGGAGAPVGPRPDQMEQSVERQAEAACLPDADAAAVPGYHFCYLLHPYPPSGGGRHYYGSQYPHLCEPDPGLVDKSQRLRCRARRDAAGAVPQRRPGQGYHHRFPAGEGRQRGKYHPEHHYVHSVRAGELPAGAGVLPVSAGPEGDAHRPVQAAAAPPTVLCAC